MTKELAAPVFALPVDAGIASLSLVVGVTLVGFVAEAMAADFALTDVTGVESV